MSAGWAVGAFVHPSGLWRRSCDVLRVGGVPMRGAGSSAMHRILSWSWAIGPDAERRETRAGDARFEKMGPFRLIGSFTYPMGAWVSACGAARVAAFMVWGDSLREAPEEAMTPCMGAPCGANCVECAAGAQ